MNKMNGLTKHIKEDPKHIIKWKYEDTVNGTIVVGCDIIVNNILVGRMTPTGVEVIQNRR